MMPIAHHNLSLSTVLVLVPDTSYLQVSGVHLGVSDENPNHKSQNRLHVYHEFAKTDSVSVHRLLRGAPFKCLFGFQPSFDQG